MSEQMDKADPVIEEVARRIYMFTVSKGEHLEEQDKVTRDVWWYAANEAHELLEAHFREVFARKLGEENLRLTVEDPKRHDIGDQMEWRKAALFLRESDR